MKDILETYRTTELRSIVSEHNKKIRKIVREDLKKIRQNILDKRLINLKGKKRGEIIEIISENKRFFKHVKPKPQQPKREPKFVIEKILQPKIEEAYKQYAKDRDLDELEDAVKKIRKTATENGVKTYHTKAKLVSMVKDAVPPVVSGKKTPPPKPGSEPRFFYDPEMKVMRLKSAPIRPSRPPPPRKWEFDFNDIHEMNGKLMTGKTHSAGSRDLTESEIERYDKAKAEKTDRDLKNIEREEKEREASKQEKKQRETVKRLKNPAKRGMILRKAEKQKKIFNDLLKKLSKVDLTKREQAYIDDLEDKVSGDSQTEKDLEKIKRLVLKYEEEIEGPKPKKKIIKKKKEEEPEEEGLKLVVEEEEKPKKLTSENIKDEMRKLYGYHNTDIKHPTKGGTIKPIEFKNLTYEQIKGLNLKPDLKGKVYGVSDNKGKGYSYQPYDEKYLFSERLNRLEGLISQNKEILKAEGGRTRIKQGQGYGKGATDTTGGRPAGIKEKERAKKSLEKLEEEVKKINDKEPKKPPPKPKAPPKKENKNIIPEFSINKKQEELMLESLPLDEYTKDDQKSLYKEIVEQYVSVKLEQTSELEASQNFDDRDDRRLFEYMLENNLFLSSDPMIKDMKIGLKEKAEFKKDLAARK